MSRKTQQRGGKGNPGGGEERKGGRVEGHQTSNREGKRGKAGHWSREQGRVEARR